MVVEERENEEEEDCLLHQFAALTEREALHRYIVFFLFSKLFSFSPALDDVHVVLGCRGSFF